MPYELQIGIFTFDIDPFRRSTAADGEAKPAKRDYRSCYEIEKNGLHYSFPLIGSVGYLIHIVIYQYRSTNGECSVVSKSIATSRR